ncbi:MAG TPA: hypothetical protein VGG34_05130 [Opitutaceae bacterium]|jgi:hypothetical protein
MIITSKYPGSAAGRTDTSRYDPMIKRAAEINDGRCARRLLAEAGFNIDSLVSRKDPLALKKAIEEHVSKAVRNATGDVSQRISQAVLEGERRERFASFGRQAAEASPRTRPWLAEETRKAKDEIAHANRSFRRIMASRVRKPAEGQS